LCGRGSELGLIAASQAQPHVRVEHGIVGARGSATTSMRGGNAWAILRAPIAGTSLTVRPSAMTARTALYLCFVTLISRMGGECRVGTEVAVANQPKICSAAGESVLSAYVPNLHNSMVLAQRVEL
jgi:hypothetical protein